MEAVAHADEVFVAEGARDLLNIPMYEGPAYIAASLIGGVAGESAHNAGLGSAEIAAPGPDAPSRHLHSAETYGDGFYINGSRHKHARCRTCGEELEPRRVG